VPATLRAIHAADPTALMAGTDLPSTRARRPFADADLELVVETLAHDAAPAVLHDNARAFYGVGGVATPVRRIHQSGSLSGEDRPGSIGGRSPNPKLEHHMCRALLRPILEGGIAWASSTEFSARA